MGSDVRPVIVLSKCINLANVRYNGGIVRDDLVALVGNYADFLPVCPEVEIGLGVPRDKIIVVKRDGEYEVFQPATGRNLTADLVAFSKKFLQSLSWDSVDGFILKAKSPSCGVSGTKVYRDEKGEKFYGLGKGIFAMKVMEYFPEHPLEDEGRLKDFGIRDNFLTRVFAFARMRYLKANIKDFRELLDFHTKHKYLLMTYSPMNLRRLGKLVAEGRKRDLKTLVEEYTVLFRKAFSKGVGLNRHINTLEHIYGHLKEKLDEKERLHFHEVLGMLKGRKLELWVVREILKTWSYVYRELYLESQYYLEPYPKELSNPPWKSE